MEGLYGFIMGFMISSTVYSLRFGHTPAASMVQPNAQTRVWSTRLVDVCSPRIHQRDDERSAFHEFTHLGWEDERATLAESSPEEEEEEQTQQNHWRSLLGDPIMENVLNQSSPSLISGTSTEVLIWTIN